ncbi:MAG: TonB-dependent receptor, partial [Bacteroidota bacterium]
KEFADIHKVKVLVGTEAIESIFQNLGGARTNFFSDDFAYRVLNAGGAGITNFNGRSETALWSTFGKVNYSLMDRYLVDVTVRRDASSVFGANNRAGVFPAASFGWRISEEGFLASIGAITDAKVRVGWGQMGSQFINANNQFTTFRTSLTASSYDIGGSNSSVVSGFDSQRFGNPDGKWEATTTINAGIDLTLWNALTINFDWYDRNTTDMLYTLTLPGVQGEAAAPAQNVGEMNNRGIDLNLAYANDALNGDFSYNIGVNFSTYKNEIVSLSLDNPNEVLVGPARRQFTYTRSEAGLPIGYFYGLKITGFTTAEDVGSGVYDDYYDRPGRFKYEDNNGRDEDGELTGQPDGKIDEADRTLIGSPHPDFTYGINIDLKYKNFDFTMFWQGVQGNNLINYVRRWTDFFTFQGNRSTRMLEQSWTPELGDAALLPELSQSDVLRSILMP